MYEGTVKPHSSRLAYPWVVGAFVTVLAACLMPAVGLILAAPLVSLLIGGAAAFWLGNAAHDTAVTAARASATAGIGGLLIFIVGGFFLFVKPAKPASHKKSK